MHPSRYFRKLLLLFIFAVFAHHYSHSQRPNIIYIMTDDLGYGDLSSYGRTDYMTPNLDKLASQGVKFVNAYAAAPLCTPTRTAFMTGRYPARTPIGLIEPLVDSAYGLTPEYPSIATLLKTKGYETALIGKWHLGFARQQSPNKNGFDYFYGIHSPAADYISHKGLGKQHDLYENATPVYHEGYLTDLFSQRAANFIKQEHQKPFFLALTFNAPHWPWQAPGDKPYHDTVSFRVDGSPTTYAAMVKSLDAGIGTVMQALDDAGLANETIVIFTNDNGGERYSNHGGLSKSKNSLWEGGIRVPAFVRWPGKIKPGTKTKQAAITMDWTATILTVAGAKPHPDFPLDGMDLLPILTGKHKPIERTFYWRTTQRAQHKALVMGEWKYLKDEKGEYLFNLSDDQGEKDDLKAKKPAIYDRLKVMYAAWEATVLPPIPLK